MADIPITLTVSNETKKYSAEEIAVANMLIVRYGIKIY
tara:strand:+ start:551 stop:664 length:114 start_codon:yes stop_codon:yes gene_type:complete